MTDEEIELAPTPKLRIRIMEMAAPVLRHQFSNEDELELWYIADQLYERLQLTEEQNDHWQEVFHNTISAEEEAKMAERAAEVARKIDHCSATRDEIYTMIYAALKEGRLFRKVEPEEEDEDDDTRAPDAAIA